MGYYGNHELKNQAQSLRKKGSSYNEIMQLLHIPKSTVSDWCKDIQLSNIQQNKLYENKMSGALKGSRIAALKKIENRLQTTRASFNQGLNDIGKLSKRDRFIAGVSYYSAEGTKTDKGCVFSNSDPSVIKFMIDWFIEFGGLPINKFYGAIWIHKSNDVQEAIKYWSKLTGIPKDNFYKSYIVENKDKSKKIQKQLHSYGVFSLYISNVALQRKIMGWIGGILQKPML